MTCETSASKRIDELSELRAENMVLRERARHYQAILDCPLDQGLFSTDGQGQVTEWSHSATRLSGWTPEEAVGRNIAFLFTAKDKAAGVPGRQLDEAAAGLVLSERWYLRRNGTLFWGVGRFAPMQSAAGETSGYVGILQDGTTEYRMRLALEQSETLLQVLFASIPVGLAMAEAPAGRVVLANEQFERSLGRTWRRCGAVAEYRLWPCFHEDGRPVQADEQPMARALAGEVRPQLEAKICIPGIPDRWVRMTGMPIRDAAGAMTHALVSVQDIDAERGMRQMLIDDNAALAGEAQRQDSALRNSQRDLLAAERRRESAEGQVRQLQKMEALGQLTGGIAHDFNNMLSVVMSGLGLTQRRLARGETNVGEFVEAAMDGARRASQLTQRLLAFSRQQTLAPVPLDANRMVGGMSDLLRRTLGGQVELETVLAGGLWTTRADPSQLENAILNLAVNARDAMEGGGRLTIESANAHLDDAYAREHAEVAAGQYVLVAVTDSGCGMSPDLIQRIFEPFFTTKEIGRGTGLGLSQVYGFIKQSAGHVKIYSEIGRGTTVKLYLPRFYGDAPRPEPAPQEPRPARSGSEVVLLVEDDERMLQLGCTMLRELGYTVIPAENAEQALRALDAHPHIALLFTDIVMPEMNGRLLAEEALRRHPALRVLYTTGYTRNAVVHNGVLDPGVELLVKPFTMEQMATKLRKIMDAP